MNILDEIVAVKKKEVEKLKSGLNLTSFKFISPDFDRKCFSLKEKLINGETTGIIAEFKKKSPSKGWINKNAVISEILVEFQYYGAAGVSILTDKKFFGGEIEELFVGRVAVDIPILRKDFIIDEIQLQQAKAYGADVILLIAAILSKQKVAELAKATKDLGMEVLLEVHDESELDHICDEVEMVGINNRDLKSFAVDIERSLKLAEKIPSEKVKIAESGINSVENILLLKHYDFKGFLIGEHFMKEADPGIAFARFVEDLQRSFKGIKERK